MLSIKFKSIGRGSKPHVLASAEIHLIRKNCQDVVAVLGATVLGNRTGELFLGFHNQVIPIGAVESPRYLPEIEFLQDLYRRICDTVIRAYQLYQVSQQSGRREAQHELRESASLKRTDSGFIAHGQVHRDR